MKTRFLAEWEALKTAFDQAAKAVDKPDEVTTKFLAVMAKPTGFTPILKEVDAAFAKEHRKAATEALNKFYAKREPLAMVLAKMAPKIADPGLNDATLDLMSGIKELEKSIQTKVKALQDEKAGEKGASDWNLLLLIETDLKKNIDKLAKDIKPAALAKIDKKHDVVSLTKNSVKHMDAYSKAAARLKAQEAKDALDDFLNEAENCAKACEAIAKKEPDKDYGEAVGRFARDLRTLCKARVAVQHKKLVEHLASAKA